MLMHEFQFFRQNTTLYFKTRVKKVVHFLNHSGCISSRTGAVNSFSKFLVHQFADNTEEPKRDFSERFYTAFDS